MRCPFCKHEDTKVLDSRDVEAAVRRRRECLSCEHRFTTYERHELGHLTVVKKDGTRESFSRVKLKKGIKRAVEKRPVSVEKVDEMIDNIESALRLKDLQEVPAKMLGELVMKELKSTDQIAYVRFASVYKEFTDIESFKDIMRELSKK